MDRLISEKAVLEAFREYQGSISDFYKAIKAIPSAEPYKGMTNGEVLCQIFPMEELYPEKMQLGMMHFCMKSNSDCMNCINMNWWNNPYSEGSN